MFCWAWIAWTTYKQISYVNQVSQEKQMCQNVLHGSLFYDTVVFWVLKPKIGLNYRTASPLVILAKLSISMLARFWADGQTGKVGWVEAEYGIGND